MSRRRPIPTFGRQESIPTPRAASPSTVGSASTTDAIPAGEAVELEIPLQAPFPDADFSAVAGLSNADPATLGNLALTKTGQTEGTVIVTLKNISDEPIPSGQAVEVIATKPA